MSFNQIVLDIICEEFYSVLSSDWWDIENISQLMNLDYSQCLACVNVLVIDSKIDCVCLAVHPCDKNTITELTRNTLGEGFPHYPETCGGCNAKLRDKDVKYTFLIRKK